MREGDGALCRADEWSRCNPDLRAEIVPVLKTGAEFGELEPTVCLKVVCC